VTGWSPLAAAAVEVPGEQRVANGALARAEAGCDLELSERDRDRARLAAGERRVCSVGLVGEPLEEDGGGDLIFAHARVAAIALAELGDDLAGLVDRERQLQAVDRETDDVLPGRDPGDRRWPTGGRW
jgi:hypothetical protein